MRAFIERILAALFIFNKRQESSLFFENLELNTRQNLQELEELKKLNFQKF